MRRILKTAVSFILILCTCQNISGNDTLQMVSPEKAGFNSGHLLNIDSLMYGAIKQKKIPGAVVLVGRDKKIVYRKAFGNRNLVGIEEKMTIDTIFDIASVTKPVATASAIWKLVENGKLRLWDKVSLYIPEFETEKDKKNPICIYHLLTHTSGLKAYYPIEELKKKYSKTTIGILAKEIGKMERVDVPGKQFNYSCLGYITLAFIVQKVSNTSIDKFTKKNIFKELDMNDTFFLPEDKYHSRIAPTEIVDGKLLRGIVHDPLARLIGGISGNAGLFSTVDDLAKFASMLLNRGVYNSKRIFSPLTVKAFISVYPLLNKHGRSPGWDVFTDYSSSRGDIFPVGSFGHTGFTGISFWIDPETKVFLIFLSNRVHPGFEGNVVQIYGLVANIVAASIIKL
ncbi:MAG: serine hydrolase [Acidobacteriota bacterium]